jgi:hypothetical protein
LFDPELLTDLLQDWLAHGQLQSATMPTDEVGRALLGILTSVHGTPGVGMEEILLRSPAPPVSPAALAALRTIRAEQ